MNLKSSFFFVFPEYDTEHTAGVTEHQRMLTPSWHPILPIFFMRSLFVLLLFCNFFLDFWIWTLFLSPHVISNKQTSLSEEKFVQKKNHDFFEGGIIKNVLFFLNRGIFVKRLPKTLYMPFYFLKFVFIIPAQRRWKRYNAFDWSVRILVFLCKRNSS